MLPGEFEVVDLRSQNRSADAAVNTQSWDPSVKGLTQFPSVLNNKAQKLDWTSQLDEALSQPTVGGNVRHPDAAPLQAIAAGNL